MKLKNRICPVINILFLSACISAISAAAPRVSAVHAFGGRQDDSSSPADKVIIPSMEEAVLAYYRGEFNSSIEMLYLIINDDPNNRSAGLSLAVLLMEAGRHEEAYTVLSDYKDPVPGNTFPAGAIWEEPSLPLFLSGNSREYLETPPPALSGNAREILQREITAEKLFFRGWALSDAGREMGEAVKSMEEALKLREYFPAANMMLGIIHYEKENYKESEHYLNLALKQDNNLTRARPYLARAILEQGRIAEAYSAFSRVRATRPWDTHSAALMKKLEKENPSLTAAAAQAAETRRVIASAPQAARFTAEPEAMPFVRIGLGENLREIYIKTGGAFKLTDSSDRLLHEGGKDTILKVNITSGMIDFFPEKREGKSAAQSAGPVTLSYDNKDSTTIMFDISYSTGYQSAGQEDRAYRGTITFIPKSRSAMTVINTLPIEEYLYSVVPSEMPSWWPPEALAAQAVSARTYTLAHMNRYQSRGFDLLGSIESAFYRGYTGERDTSSAAVDSTRGIVMKNSGKYLNAYYSANSAGRTESALSVWGMNIPVIGVTDPGLSFSSSPPAPDELARWILSEPPSYSSVPGHYYRQAYRWRLIVPREEIEAKLGQDIGEIMKITTLGRGGSGRVQEVLIQGSTGVITVKGDSIRSRLGGLRSNLFIVMPRLTADGNIDSFIFAGAGWGHGVGMCQSGAAGMAAEGFKSAEILNHYYPLAELEKEY